MPIFVRVKDHPTEPLLVGQVAAVTGQDWVPWCEPDEKNPLLDLLFPSGHIDSLRASQVEILP